MNTAFEISDQPLAPQPETPRTVLITGAGGRIGSSLAAYARDRYRLRLLVRDPEQGEKIAGCGVIRVGNLSDPAVARSAVEDIDTVVHLAAEPHAAAGWDSLLPNNIEAVHNVVTAAGESGCRRIVLASSVHAVLGYPPDYQVHNGDPVNPPDLYGVTKCFAEAMARYAAGQLRLSAIVLRIGGFVTPKRAPAARRSPEKDILISPRDMNQLISRCIDDNRLRFAIFHALSANRYNRMDISAARDLLGYRPQDDFWDAADEKATKTK